LGDDGVNQGMLVENAVAQQLATAGHELYFYSKNSAEKDERMEIDFLVVRPFSDAAMKPRVSPIEVKSGKRYSTLSLDKFSKKFGKQAGTEYVLHPRQLATEKSRVYLPLYMAHLL
jgi:predicted AAA+ superfamily ATPase